MIYLVSLLIMGGIATVLGVILVILDHYLTRYGECRIMINEDTEYNVAGGQSLLSYLIQNRIFIPSACGGRATCGFCKLAVTDGGGPVLPTEIPFLSKKEISGNIRLACQVKVKSDIQVIISEEYLSIQEFKAIVVRIYPLNYDTKEISLKLLEPATISFNPGQYIQFCVPGTFEYRAYSIASSPSGNDTIELIVRLVPGGCCSTYMHKILKEGDEVTLTGPYGGLALREDSSKDIICVGGGCGMAPFRSIIRHLFETDTARNVTYFYGAQIRSDLYYIDEFKEVEKRHENFRFIVALSNPGRGDKWSGEEGLIHQIVSKHLGSGENVEAYLCGPSAMIDATISVLISKGVREEDILFDKI